MSTRAIVRRPSTNFGEGLTSAGLGAPDYSRAIDQHTAYCSALERCGLTLTTLEPDSRHPDSTFVEDTAVVTRQFAVLTRPGAPTRVEEVALIKNSLASFYSTLHTIREPGTLDGGDICQADNHFFIGISKRTNEAGAEQLSELLESFNYTSSLVDILPLDDILHLKSGLAYVGNNRLVVIDSLASRKEFRDYDLIRVTLQEQYAANCVRVNGYVLIAAGYPVLERSLRTLGYQTLPLEMSEFQKMDGGLSCLSLRF
ncbi:MAG TPA: arginine deiminase family protein [Pyrinomonadaceae bacterium]|nr:arginine deiminase family protein [Pyrinomonadaceae bacterium]